jgi:asparagine synthase (glutamine-hydrolysing)
MAHSLEARVPFVDHRLLELAGSIPDGLQVRGLAKKWLLRRAVRPLLPDAVVDGRKRGFSIPAARWLRQDARDLVIDLLSPEAVRRQGLFRPEAVQQLVREHLDGRSDQSRPLWGLLCLALWEERIGRAAGASLPHVPAPGAGEAMRA